MAYRTILVRGVKIDIEKYYVLQWKLQEATNQKEKCSCEGFWVIN